MARRTGRRPDRRLARPGPGVTIFASDTIDAIEHWAPLQFNAWNTFHDTRPLGQLFRLRRHAHAAHSEARVSHLYGATPGEMVGKCPFGQA